MNRFAVFGNPISHSLSPMIHNEFSNELGINLSYEKILSPIDEFEFTANQFINDGGLGFNITLPFKVEAFNFSQELTSNASAAGAVNTIKIDNNVIIGENTDGNGLVNDLEINLAESNGSGGVTIAANTNDKTIAYFLKETSCSIVSTPNFTSRSKITGNWNASPKANMNVIINDKYSFILAWRVILIPSAWELWKLKKNFHATGDIT